MADAEATAVPLKLIVSSAARKRFADVDEWLRGQPDPFGGDEAAALFSATLAREILGLCASVAERLAAKNDLPRPDEEASIAFARPAYRHIFTATGNRRRRRQTAGVWLLFYDLPNETTLQVLFLRHGAAQPLSMWLDEADERVE